MGLPRIQVSYAPQDQAFANQLFAALRQQQYTVYDPLQFLAFDDAEIKEIRLFSLEGRHVSIFLLSPAALQSSLVQIHLEAVREVQTTDKNVYIVSLIIAPVEVPHELQNYTIIETIGRSFADIMNDLDAFLATVPQQSYVSDYLDDDIRLELEVDEERQAHTPPPAASAPPPAASSQGTSLPESTKSIIHSKEPGKTTSPAHTLQFSAYYPKAVPVATWQTLLVYSYIAETLAQIEADAATFAELGSNPHIAHGAARQAILAGAELIIEPHAMGVSFSPAQDAFIWRGDWHRSLLRFRGAPSLADQTVVGWIDIYAGPMVPIARIDMELSFQAATNVHPAAIPHGITVTSNIYDTVFISYSHRDAEAFEQACEEYQRFGIAVATDQQLAAGDNYEQALAKMITAAQVFHLLWSHHSAASAECRKEWLRALEREPTERFIKPWYWQRPFATPPAEIAAHHISFRYQRLKRKLLKPATWF